MPLQSERLRSSACLLLAIIASIWSMAAVAQTKQQATIAVYAGLAEKVWKKVVADPMTASSGIQIKIFGSALPAASVAQSEGHPDFDLALIAAYSAPGLVSRGLVQLLTPEDIPAIRNVPERFWPRTPDGKLMGMPVYYSIYGIAFNTELAKAADFQSWTNLLDTRWKGQVSMSRPSFVAAYDVTLFAKLNGGDEQNVEPGYRFVEKLARNVLTVYTSMASLESQLGRGEVAAAPFYSNEIKSLRRGGVTNVDTTIPKEGGLMLPYLLIIPKGAANTDAAKRVLNTVIEPSYQVGFAEESGDWPMNQKADLPEALQRELGGTVQDMMAKNVSADWYVVGSHLDERTHYVEELIQKAQ